MLFWSICLLNTLEPSLLQSQIKIKIEKIPVCEGDVLQANSLKYRILSRENHHNICLFKIWTRYNTILKVFSVLPVISFACT